MNQEIILKEAQKIAANFSFWMVSGKISHLYGYVYEKNDNKYDMEIKFDNDFPNTPPNFIYHDAIKNLLGDFQLGGLKNWTSDSSVVKIIEELEVKIQNALSEPIETLTHDEYITPDLNAYPPDFDSKIFDSSDESMLSNQSASKKDLFQPDISQTDKNDLYVKKKDGTVEESETVRIETSTELGLIQQYYSFDQKGSNSADINVYLTITIAKTFIIGINFFNYPEKPIISLPEQVKSILGDPYNSLDTLKKWNVKKPLHIIDILHEIENKLFFITHIENEANKILSEYKCYEIESSITKLKVHLVTYGFKEYLLELDLMPYPKPPDVSLSSELQAIIQIPISSLNAYQNWRKDESEPVEIIREISWLVDKNSRINFEIELLKEHYKDLKYDNATQTLVLNMKGKMKTQDITFEFQINLPKEYPMKMPGIKVLNEFEIETHEKIKSDLQSSFKDFFDEWTPYSYLVDLFNLISEKIFEVSVVACVICHKIECPTCSVRIAGPGESCHVACVHCDRVYHKHCWDQTIKSFGKCGFCLKVPPPNMIP